MRMIYIFRKEMKKWHSILWTILASMVLGAFLSYVGYKRTQPSQVAIATVNGKDVKLLDFQKSLMEIRSQIDMYREYARMMGVSMDLFLSMAGLLNPEKAAFDKCLNNRLLDTQKDFYNIELNVEYFLDELEKRLPAHLKDSVGNINFDAYNSYLARMGTKPSEFEDKMESNMERELFEQFLESSYYVPFLTAKEIFINNIAKKSFNIVHFPFEKYLDIAKKENIDENQLEKFFNKNKEVYRVPEKRDALYWRLNSEDYLNKVSIDEGQVQYFYDRNKDSLFRIPPKVSVRHIFFEVTKDFSAEKIDQILDKAREIKKELEKDSQMFGELAKKYSNDTKTAQNGGFIGFIEKGALDSEFEKAAYRLYKKGEVSDIVKTDDGFEIIQLEQRVAADIKPLDAVKGEIIKTLKAKKALTELNADVQRLLYEARNDKNAPISFLKQNKISSNQTGLVQENKESSQELNGTVIEKIFSSNKKEGEFGVFNFKDDKILYQIVNIQKSFISDFKEIRSSVEEDFYNDLAKKLVKKDIKDSKRSLINKNKTLKEVAVQSGLKLVSTKAIKSTDNLEDFDFGVDFDKKAFMLMSSDQALTYKNDSEYYLVQLKDIEQTNLIKFSDEKNTIVTKDKNNNKPVYSQAFIASLLRTARIETFGDFSKFNA
jgi:peptidyl-prolyl cis-trans isomerase D